MSSCSEKLYYNWYSKNSDKTIGAFFDKNGFDCSSYVILKRLKNGNFGIKFYKKPESSDDITINLVGSSKKYLKINECSIPVIFLDEYRLYNSKKGSDKRGLIIVEEKFVVIDVFDLIIDSSGNIVEQE